MAHDVFISHSSRNKTVADAICANLEKVHFRCWVAPRDIRPGAAWAEAIAEGIKDSRVFVLVFSRESNHSEDVFREISMAASRGIPIVAFRIHEVEPTGRMEYYLKPMHWLDAVDPPLEIRLQQLGDTVQRLLAQMGKAARAAEEEAKAEAEARAKARAKAPPPRVVSESAKPPRRPLVLIASGAAAIAVAAAIIVVALLYGGGEDVVSGSTTTTITEAITTTTTRAIQEKWKFKTGGKVPSTPAIADGMVYFWSTEGYLFAVDTATGEERWRHEAARGPWGYANGYSPALAEGMVYVNAHDGIAKLDAKTGAEEGSFKTDEGFESASVASSPVACDGVLYFGLMMADRPRSPMYAVNAKTMRKLWRFEPGGPMTYSPAVSGGVVYFRVGADICAVDVRGSEKWRFTTGSNAVSPPTISDAVVYFGSGEGYLYALDAETRQEKWRFETGGVITYSPTVSDGVVYVVSRDGCLYAVYTASGQEKWKFKPSASISCSPAVWGGVVYFGSWDNCLHAVEASSGQEKWRFNTDGATTFAPTVADDVVYFGSDDGYLYAVSAQ